MGEELSSSPVKDASGYLRISWDGRKNATKLEKAPSSGRRHLHGTLYTGTLVGLVDFQFYYTYG